MREAVLVGRHEKVMTVTRNGPEARNAVHRAATAGAGEALEAAGRTPDVWAGIIAGAGDESLDAGAQLQALGKRAPFTAGAREQAWGCVERHIPKPPTAVDGPALCRGAELTLASDLTVALESTITMAQTGELISAPRALELGLLDAVAPQALVLDAALRLARRITATAPLAAPASERIALGIQYGKIASEAAAWAPARAAIAPPAPVRRRARGPARLRGEARARLAGALRHQVQVRDQR